jgi:biotin transport system substrate-specific component
MQAIPPRSALIDALWPAEGAQGLARNVLLAVTGSLLLWLSAKINVPFYPVPMTMQTFAVLVIGAAFGWKLGAATVLLYLAEGAAGLPVFAGTPERGLGLTYMFGPTGGYLLGFVAGAALTGWLAENGWGRSFLWLMAAMLIGHVVIFVYGLAWLANMIGIEKAWATGVAPFYLATLFKTVLAAACMRAGWFAVNPRS